MLGCPFRCWGLLILFCWKLHFCEWYLSRHQGQYFQTWVSAFIAIIFLQVGVWALMVLEQVIMSILLLLSGTRAQIHQGVSNETCVTSAMSCKEAFVPWVSLPRRRVCPSDVEFLLLFTVLHSSTALLFLSALVPCLQEQQVMESRIFLLLQQAWLRLQFLALLVDPVELSSYPS